MAEDRPQSADYKRVGGKTASQNVKQLRELIVSTFREQMKLR